MVQIERVPLRKQVDSFEQSRRYMANVLGERETSDFLKRAVFSLTIGSNDIINYILPSLTYLSAQKFPPTVYQSLMISNLTMQLQVKFFDPYAHIKLVDSLTLSL